MTTASYNEHSIRVLKGLEPVQKNPGMYTRTDCPNHIVQEVVDNAQDEALGGHAHRIAVILHDDFSVSVEDDGRGIPTSLHPTEGVPTIELVFMQLHAGGKFDKGHDSAYAFTGGLHGVGVSVTNALSERLNVTVWRDGYEHTIAFSNGVVVEPLSKKRLPPEERHRTGTRVHLWPNPRYFEQPSIQVTEMERLLCAKAVLLPGAHLSFQRPGKPLLEWHYPEGIQQYLHEKVGDQGAWLTPVFQASLHYTEPTNGFERGEGFDLAIGWLDEGRAVRESFVNLIPTVDGGRHETGLRAGLLDSVRRIGERMGWIPKGVKIESEDVVGHASFVLSLKMLEAKFQGQTKDRLTSEPAQRLVMGLLRDALDLWLNEHLEEARKIVDLAVNEAIRRNKTLTPVERRRSSSAIVLPGKLTDCEEKNVERTELFLTEGDSAAGSAKAGRNRATQAVLPIRGKLLNTWDVESHKLAKQDTVSDISMAIGVEPHPGQRAADVDLSKLRYGRICILADADVDGFHIQVLLLTLFYKHFPALIETQRVWIAQSPLYRIDAPPKKRNASSRERRKFYALDDKERQEIERDLIKEGLSSHQWTVSRFKGLGEMDPSQLWETTMDPETRRMLRITLKDMDDPETKAAFELMMGPNAQPRREWMSAEGHTVEADT